MNLVSLCLTLVVGGIGCAAGGLISLTMLHWAWRGGKTARPGESWPSAKRWLLAGAILGIVFGVLKVVFWERLAV
jgi:hypothetical protein